MKNFLFSKKTFFSNKGLSIIEVIIYIALLAMVLSVLISTSIVLLKSYKLMTTSQIIDSSALLTLDRIGSVARSSTSIDYTHTTFDSSAGVLTLNAVDTSNNPYVAKFYVSGGVVKLDINGVYEGQLTSSSTQVVSLMFRRVDTPVSSAVRTEVTLTTDVNGYTKTENFYTTSILKNSY